MPDKVQEIRGMFGWAVKVITEQGLRELLVKEGNSLASRSMGRSEEQFNATLLGMAATEIDRLKVDNKRLRDNNSKITISRYDNTKKAFDRMRRFEVEINWLKNILTEVQFSASYVIGGGYHADTVGACPVCGHVDKHANDCRLEAAIAEKGTDHERA